MKENPADTAARAYLEEDRERWGKTENILLIALCVLFFAGLTVLFFALPKNEYSKTENRMLADTPEFSTETLEAGKYRYNRYAFLDGVVSYINDHFPFRDGFMAVNGLYNVASGRLGCGGVVLGNDGYLLYEESAATDLQKEKLKGYAEIVDILSGEIDSVVAVAGKGDEVMIAKYPAAIDTSAIAENRALINETFSNKNYAYIDLAAALAPHACEEIYYRTDHHWTHLGAYYAASEILKELGATAAGLGNYRKEVVLTDFKGTLYNRSGLFFLPGEELFYLRYEGDCGYRVSFCDSRGTVTGVSDSLYDPAPLAKDYRGTAYDSFVAPVSTPVVRIEKEGEERPTLLVLKDSFAHSTLSYLARSFDLITVDIRSADFSYVENLILQKKVDRLLVLVNPATLFGAE